MVPITSRLGFALHGNRTANGSGGLHPVEEDGWRIVVERALQLGDRGFDLLLLDGGPQLIEGRVRGAVVEIDKTLGSRWNGVPERVHEIERSHGAEFRQCSFELPSDHACPELPCG